MRRHGGAVVLVLVGLSLLPLVSDALQNGDSAVYNDQIDQGELRRRTVHFGYLLLGRALHVLLRGATDREMNLLTLVLGMTGVLAVYATAHALTRSTVASFAAGLGLLAAPLYLRGTLLSEVDVPVAALVALALALWIHGHDKMAAAVYGYAMLVSPLASLGLPAFLCTPSRAAPEEDARRAARTQLRRVARFALVSLAVYLPFVILFHHDYFYGGRGLFRAPRAAYDLGVQLERSAVFFAREPWLVALYAAGAVVALARGVRGWLAGVAAVAVVSALAGERFKDVPVQLTTTALASPLIAFVVSSLLSLAAVERRGALLVLSRVAAALAVLAVAAALFLTGRVALARTRALIRHSERFRAALLELARSFPDELTLVHSQGFGQSRTFERVLFGRTRNGRVMSRRDFETHCAAYASERHTFWIAQAPFDAPCPELEERYERTSRELYGSRFHLLVPNDRR